MVSEKVETITNIEYEIVKHVPDFCENRSHNQNVSFYHRERDRAPVVHV